MPKVILIETMDQLHEALEAFTASDRFLAFDTETTGLQVRSPYGDKGRTLQVSWRPWKTAYVLEMTPKWQGPINAIFHEAEAVVGHNVKFDAHVMETYGVEVYGRFDPLSVHDTGWLARLHDERDKPRLKELSAKYLQADAADEQTKLKRIMRKHEWDWATVPVAYLIEYGGLDAIFTGRLFDYLRPKVRYADDAYAREQRLAEVLFKMERTGLLIDPNLLDEVIAEEEAALAEAEAECRRLAPGINLNSPIQLKSAFRDRDMEVEDTKAATLKAIDDDFARAILIYRNHQKNLSTYLLPWRELVTPKQRLHPSFNQLGTVTGRFSSDHPNLQNISKSRGGNRLRDIFIAAPGHQLIVADWNQMELRLYAHFAKDENMRAAFISGDDIYEQASDILGVPRDIGKMIMLASIYGAGPKTLKSQCIAMAWKYGLERYVPDLQGYDWKALYERFHSSYNIKDLARLTELAARRRGMLGEPYIRTLGGRRQRPKHILLPPVNGYRHRIEVYKDLGNSLVQGSSADLMKQALLDVSRAGYGDYLRLTVHDEMVLEVPDAEVEEVAQAVERIMTHHEFIPPLTAEVTMATRYGKAK